MTNEAFCGKEEHIHDPESCYARVLVCGQDAPDEDTSEQPEHVHTDACYQDEAILVCELAEGEGAHLHTADCFDEAGNIVCGLEENLGHQHTADCYRTSWVLICGQEEGADEEAPAQHEHTDACYEDLLICELEEHQHSLACARLTDNEVGLAVVEDGVDVAQDGFIAKGLVYMLDFYHGFLLF